MKSIQLLIFILSISIFPCNSSEFVDGNRVLTYKNDYKTRSGNGIVILSVSRQTDGKIKPHSAVCLGYRSLDRKISGCFAGSLLGEKTIRENPTLDTYFIWDEEIGDFDEEIFFKSIPGLNIEELPAGKYEIYSWFFIAGACNAVGCHRYFPKIDFSIPFEVKEGKTVYIGHANANVITNGGLFANSPQGIKITFSDKSKRDKELAKMLEAKVLTNLSTKPIGQEYFTNNLVHRFQ